MVRTLTLVALLGLLTAPVAGQGGAAYTIKLKHSAQGDVLHHDKTEQNTTVTKITDNQGKALKEATEKRTRTAVFTETIVEKKKGEDKATRLKRQYKKAVNISDDKKHTLPYEGKTVLIEKRNDRYVFRIEGGAEITGEDAKDLDEEFNKKGPDTKDFDKLFLPGKPVKVGETWKLDQAQLNKQLQADGSMEVHADKTAGTAKLTKAYKKAGRQFGVIDVKLEISPRAFKEGDQRTVLQPGARMVVELSLDGCIDGTTAIGSGQYKMTLNLQALLPSPDNPQATLTVNTRGGGTQKTTE